ncbi:hypothetical protein B0A48_03466 [Cryoendolithus antarcticus]|uniref:Uncharacterized protein n=1 Tax=Cryoendolithus antarcticus TaxID=1507870 RepID=A0A1V8TK47_9PEZI|nr:hypothetical protein B0A48_03466 [Cryoendolithus antarcticus]
MDDWQDTAFSNRHVHNRIGKQGRGKGGKANGAFNVQRTLGTYEVKCAAAAKVLRSAASDSQGLGSLEIYTLNDLGNALIGELNMPGVLNGTVLMAGSRKTMKIAIEHLRAEGSESEESEVDGAATHDGSLDRPKVDNDDDQGFGAGSDDIDDESTSHDHFDEFEKNSFRSPKFWLKWQGQVTAQVDDDGVIDETVTDSGYLVFSGNTCERFNGTLSCSKLDWHNVKITGFKLRSKPARDFDVQWVHDAKG